MSRRIATPGSSLLGIGRCLYRVTADAVPAYWEQDVRPWLVGVMYEARKVAADRRR